MRSGVFMGVVRDVRDGALQRENARARHTAAESR
jgi:hypothetical protein